MLFGCVDGGCQISLTLFVLTVAWKDNIVWLLLSITVFLLLEIQIKVFVLMFAFFFFVFYILLGSDGCRLCLDPSFIIKREKNQQEFKHNIFNLCLCFQTVQCDTQPYQDCCSWLWKRWKFSGRSRFCRSSEFFPINTRLQCTARKLNPAIGLRLGGSTQLLRLLS